jgi:mannan endo-1,4-beta-mannosidase
VLTRVNAYTGIPYRDDPTIFSWELLNEPRLPSEGTAGQNTLQARGKPGYNPDIKPNYKLKFKP